MPAFTEHAYRGTPDQLGMTALVRVHPEYHLHVVDLPYRLSSWAFDHPGNVRLWRDSNGRLAGWAVLATPFWTLDIACRPDSIAQLYPTILSWAAGAVRRVLATPFGHPVWFVNAISHQSVQIAALEAVGWACQSDVGEDSWSQVLLSRQASDPLPHSPLPPGYTLRPLAGESEVETYVDLHQAVFETKNMTVAWRQRTLVQPEYRPELDLIAVAPSGELAAFCIGWLSPDGRTGQIEPIGVSPHHRRFGLGRALLSVCLERMHTLGAGTVYVLTDNFRGPALELYVALGFRLKEDVYVYRWAV